MKLSVWGLLAVVAGLLPAYADMPGNTPRQPVSILLRLGDLKGFTIYSNGPGDYNDDVAVKDSTTILLNGGYGAPPCVTFFGILNGKTYTDSVTVCNEEQGNLVMTLSVEDGSLVTDTEYGAATENEVAVLTDGTSGPDEGPGGQIRILVWVALVSLVLLVAGFFTNQRKRQAL